MRVHDFGDIILHEAADFHHSKYYCRETDREQRYRSEKHYVELNRHHIEMTAHLCTRRRAFTAILKEYGAATGLAGTRILRAHGSGRGKRWRFWDGRRRHDVQRWIDLHDGQTLAIILECCNPSNREITSSQSLVIHPLDSINVMDLIHGGHLRMCIPDIGYLQDRPYALTEALEAISGLSAGSLRPRNT